MKQIKTKLSLFLATLSLLFIPTTAYSRSFNNLDSLSQREELQLIIAQNNDPTSLINQGWELYNNQQYEEAINYYEEAINLQPNLIEAWLGKAVALYDLERYQEAINCFDQVINLEPNFPNAYAMRGAVYVLIDEPEKAISDLKLAAQIYQQENQTQEYQETVELIAIIEAENNANVNQNEDLQDLTNAEFDQNNPYAFFDQGYYFYELEQYQEAIIAFNQAIEIKPDFAEAYGIRGGSYFMIGDKEKALADLQIAAQLFSNQDNNRDYEKILQLIQLVEQN